LFSFYGIFKPTQSNEEQTSLVRFSQIDIDSKLMLKFVENRGTIWRNCDAISVQFLEVCFAFFRGTKGENHGVILRIRLNSISCMNFNRGTI